MKKTQVNIVKLLARTLAFATLISTSGVIAQSPELAFDYSQQVTPEQVVLQLERQRDTVADLEVLHGPFDYRLAEALQSLAGLQREVGDLETARLTLNQALHVSRVNEGLYSESQIGIIDSLIEISVQLSDWPMVDRHFGYLEHLVLKLFAVDDPRREEGLRMVVAWHVDAWNANIDDNRPEHMRQAKRLFMLRLQSAQAMKTLNEEHIRFLKTNIALSQRLLNISSGIHQERRQQRAQELRDRYLASLD
ncbi:MAG: hypothetical protein RLZZ385_1099 [Pseudomonadota bacterium]|jgi:hypothetical protein